MDPRPRKRGRPRSPAARSAAERMQLMRARKRKAGLRLKQSWISAVPADYSDHQLLDARSLALHCLVARRLPAEPELVARASDTLSRWKQQIPDPVPAWFGEWEQVLRRTPRQIAAFLAEMSPNATRLRQSSPFSVLVTPEERERVYVAFR